MQSNRLFETLYILLNKERVTAGELAKRFGVSTRTIYRDIDALSLAGIPIYTDKGKGGGISLLPDFIMDKSILSEQEQSDILSAIQGLIGMNVTDSDSVLQKLSATFNKTAINWLEVDFSDWHDSDGDLFNELKSAILECKLIQFDYFNSHGESSYRRVEPMQLWFKSKAWYLKGFCLGRQNLRIFKLTRMRNLAVTNDSFEQRNLLAMQSEAKYLQSTKKRKEVTLKLKFAPEVAYRVLDDFGEGTQLEDGSYIGIITWPEDEWLYGFILSFGAHIEVLEPQHIREVIREKTKEIHQKYL